MNKIIPVISALILSGCATEQVNSSVTYSATPGPVAASSPEPANLSYRSKHYSRLSFIKTTASDYQLPEEKHFESALPSYSKQGRASWYGSEFHGKKTATGEIFDMYGMTAAHKTLPLSSYAKVTNLKNHRSVIVRINDRGPYHGNRLLDLSYAAAKELEITRAGTGTVEIKAVSPSEAFQQTADRQEKPIYLQVGSFGNQQKALQLKDKIAANDLPQTTILHSKHKHSSRYKVQIGPIQDSNKAEKINQKLARLGITDTRFVSEVE